MKEWSNLPNAKHIDWVIQSVKDNPREWAVAINEVWGSARDAAWEAERGAERAAAWVAAYYAATDAGRDAACSAARDAGRDAARGAGRGAAYDATLALVAYDDIEHYLFSSYEELRLIAELSKHPGAKLLLPAVKARELIEVKNERVV